MSKKYVIEINPEYDDSFKGLLLLGAKDSDFFVDSITVDELEELNSEYINENFGSLQDEAYQKGLDDAWEAVQKIMDMPDPPYWDVFCEYKNELFKKLSAPEVIAKLKAYEDGKQPMYDIQAALKRMASEAEMSITELANRIKDMYK